jgi:hypothetical protein
VCVIAGGGIQAAGTLSALHTGEKLIVAGLFTQLFFFAIFIGVAGVFHYRLVKGRPMGRRTARNHQLITSESRTIATHNLDELPWQRHLYNLYITSGLIMVRSIFRVVEYLQGNAGYLLSHEVFLYVFDAVLMLAVMGLFNWVHPSEITEAHEKKQVDSVEVELRSVEERYLGRVF